MLKLSPVPFLTKTYEMVDDSVTDDVISWSESGNSFVVWKNAEFSMNLLPKYFKHNNFSSFVRQLNTYGFRKIVPDKWEFSHENFKRGETELLPSIKRKKTVPSSLATRKSGGISVLSASNSGVGEDMGSTSTGSIAPNTHSADLSGENEKLKKDNEKLSCELARAKKQCDELVAFLKDALKVGPDQINRIIQQGTSGSSIDTVPFGDDDSVVGECEKSFKLFGVWVKRNEGKDKLKIGDAKGNCRKREDEEEVGGANKELKTVV